MLEKIKEFIKTKKKELILFVILFLMLSLTFALGYIAGRETSVPDIIIQKNSQ